MSDQQTMRATYEAFASAWASRDVHRLMELVTDDVMYGASVGPEPGRTYRGRAEVEAGFRAILAHDNALSVRRGVTEASGDYMFVEWEYELADESGTPNKAHGMDIIQFRDGKICMKQAFRKASEETVPDNNPLRETVPQPLSPYRQRRFGFLGLWDFGDLRIKAYGITTDLRTDTEIVSADVIAAAKVHASERMEHAAEAEGGHHGVGYLILHQGMDANWLLLDWWAHGEINCHLLSSSSADAPEDFTPVSRPLMACVWEMVVIEHERRAWIRHMLRDVPDAQAYLADRLRDGFY